MLTHDQLETLKYAVSFLSANFDNEIESDLKRYHQKKVNEVYFEQLEESVSDLPNTRD